MKKSFLFLMMLIAAATVSAQDLVDRVSKAVGVELPNEYQVKVKEYVKNSKVLSKIGGRFAEQFIVEQMKENWGISKQNQLLFIWDAIYEQVTKKNFYDGEDGNKQRLDDYEKALFNDNIEACGKKYTKDYNAYLDKVIAEADRRSAEADKEIMAQDTIWVKERMTEFYDLYKRNPANIKKEDLTFMIESTKDFIAQCKKYNIDYKAILRKELGTEQKAKDLLKFYGIE